MSDVLHLQSNHGKSYNASTIFISVKVNAIASEISRLKKKYNNNNNSTQYSLQFHKIQ